MTGVLPINKCQVHSQTWDAKTVLLCVTPRLDCPKKRNPGVFNYECIVTIDPHYDEVTEWIKINSKLSPEKDINPCDKCENNLENFECEDCTTYEKEIDEYRERIKELEQALWDVDINVDNAYKEIDRHDLGGAFSELDEASKNIRKVK